VRLYFLNSERGRAALRAIEKGEWKPTGDTRQPIALDMERPNVFRLYEENIGPLTPLIADVLREAEATYPLEWIQEAVRIAVENNVRRWRYVEAILSSWKKEGRDAKDRRDTEEDRHKYVKGKYADFVEH
jgi:DnaD/phage-associated family protein